MRFSTALNGMRVPCSEHEAHGWVLRTIAPDFILLDASAIPIEGSREDFASALDLLTGFDPITQGSPASRLLFHLRLRAGKWLHLDDPQQPLPIPGCKETSLRVRLPAALVDSAAVPRIHEAVQKAAGGFKPLFRTSDEWAAELSNRTVHGVLQLVWVQQPSGRFQGRLAVYVKPRGTLGRLYLCLIAPFRHLIVYPAMLRAIGDAWVRQGHSRFVPSG